jgi:prepilin-type N-terminal cleavage/methylation domain-containing protein
MNNNDTSEPKGGCTAMPLLRVATGLYRSGGFSVIELMIAMAIGAIMMIALTNLLIDNKTAYVREDQFARLQEGARISALLTSRHLRSNRSLGCRSLGMTTLEGRLTVKACKLIDTPDDGACDDAGWSSRDNLISLDRALGYDGANNLNEPDNLSDLPSAAAGDIAARWLRGDIVVTWGVDDDGISLTASLPEPIGESGGFQGTGALSVAPVPSALGNVGRLALITDCVNADLVEISGPNGLAAGDTSIQHVAESSAGGTVNASDGLSSAYNWSAPEDQPLVPGPVYRATVYPFSYDAYYICCVDTEDRALQTDDDIDNCRNGDTDRYRPSLCVWSMENSNASNQALITDIADMRVTYTGDTDSDNELDFFADDTDPIPTATWVSGKKAWSGVRSAEIELLVSTGNNHVTRMAKAPAKASWPPGNGSVVSDTLGAGLTADTRLYERFVTTVAMRARTPWYLP